LFRIRMSRNFGMKMLTMTNLSTECLIQLTKLGYDATPFNQILKQNAKREMRLRLGKVTDRKSGSAGMPRPSSYAVFCLKKKKHQPQAAEPSPTPPSAPGTHPPTYPARPSAVSLACSTVVDPSALQPDTFVRRRASAMPAR